jgi:carbonic anhydrase
MTERKKMSFCTVINCMDGRTQLPVNEYLRGQLNVDYVDTITEAGPVLILAEQQGSQEAKSILERANISVNKHGSKTIAIVAHYDCTGNPADKDKQLSQLKNATQWLSEKYPDVKILGLWVDSDWAVSELT